MLFTLGFDLDKKKYSRNMRTLRICSIPAISKSNTNIHQNISVLHWKIKCITWVAQLSAEDALPHAVFLHPSKCWPSCSLLDHTLNAIWKANMANRPYNSHHHSEKIKFIYTSYSQSLSESWERLIKASQAVRAVFNNHTTKTEKRHEGKAPHIQDFSNEWWKSFGFKHQLLYTWGKNPPLLIH